MEEISFEEWRRRHSGKPMLTNSQRCLVALITTIGAMVLGFHLFPGPQVSFLIVIVSVLLGNCAYFLLFDEEEDLRRRWKDETETDIQRPQQEARRVLGRYPSTEELRAYTKSHLWFRQPYCICREKSHCKDCNLRSMKETRYRVGNTVVLSDGFVADCRGRPPTEAPLLTVCTQCKYARRHRMDDFFDCLCGYVRWGDRGVPDGRNIYSPLYYPVAPGCPYFERTDDPKMIEYNKACEREVKAWNDALAGKAQIDLDERYGKDNE